MDGKKIVILGAGLAGLSAGWKALFYPEAICYHYGNSSFSDKPLRKFLCWRNRRFLLAKCRLSRLKLFIISLLYDFPRFAYLFLTNHYVRNANLYKDISFAVTEAKALKG